MAVGMVTGAAMASAASSANSANAYNAGYVAGTSNSGASSANSYNAGYVAGSTNTAAVAGATSAYTGGNAPIGAIYATLPAGCMAPSGLGSTYYLCGNTWFKPSYGANGVYYRVVSAP